MSLSTFLRLLIFHNKMLKISQVILIWQQVWCLWSRQVPFRLSSALQSYRAAWAPPWEKGAGMSTQSGSQHQNNSHFYLFLYNGKLYRILPEKQQTMVPLLLKKVYKPLYKVVFKALYVYDCINLQNSLGFSKME